MDTRSTVDRAPVMLTKDVLGASATEYYPTKDGQDVLGSIGLWGHVSAKGWANESGTLTLEVSDDRLNWSTLGSALTFTADVLNTFNWITLTKRYWRWKFVNDGTAQGEFRLFEDKVPDVNGAVDPTPVQGDTAHDAADTGNPVKIGFTAESTTPAAVIDGDRSNWAGTLYGAGFVNPVTSAGAQTTGATGAAVPAGAAMVAGTDGTNLRAIKVDANGVPFVQGEVAHDAADSGNPVKIGGKATAAAPTAVTEGDRVNASFTLAGSQRVEVTGGSVAHDAASTANPILTGFVAESTIPAAVVDGDFSQDAGTLYGARFVNPVTSAGVQVTGAIDATPAAGATQIVGANIGATLARVPTVDTFASSDGHSTNQKSMSVEALNAVFNGTTWDRQRSAASDAQAATGIQAVVSMVWNGTTYDRADGVNTGQQVVTLKNSSGVEPAVSLLGDAASNGTTKLLVHNFPVLFNETTWDRARNVTGDAMAVTGLQAIVPMVWNGTTYDRLDGVNTGQAVVTPKGSAGSEVIGATGAAVPAGAVMVAGTDGTNLRAIKTGTDGVPFVQGEIAHDAADSGNPVKIGGKATAAAPAAVTEGDRVNASFTLAGSQRVEVTAAIPAGTNVTGGITGGGIMAAATPSAATAVSGDVNALVAAVAGLRLVGWSVKETASATAALNIVHGATGAGGANICPILLAADESSGDWYGPDGIAVASGLSIDWVSGASLIVLYTKVVA